MEWPFNYPGDDYLTNVFSQVIILLDDIKESTIDLIDDIVQEITNDDR